MRIRGNFARRAVIGVILTFIATAAWCTATAYRASALGETRTLSMYNIHTKESLTVTFKRDGKYDQAALKQLNTFMRDWRANKQINMDPALIDLIWTLHKQLGSNEPVHLVCGYRSAETNASLRRKGGGQAKNSQHILGKAADITFPDVPVTTLRASALVQEVGGVGFYPTSGVPFVHVDTGHQRMWPRLPRLELAALFPSGRSKYIPIDGKPITPQDYKLAMAQGLVGKATMVASAAPSTQTDSADDADAEPEMDEAENTAETPQPILAYYTPGSADLSDDSRAPPPAGRLFTYASLGGSLPVPSFLRPRSSVNAAPSSSAAPDLPRRDNAAASAAPQDKRTSAPSRAPLEIAELMTDTSIIYSSTMAPLVHPEQGNVDYLFEDIDDPSAPKLRQGSEYQSLASIQRFSGRAVRNLYAEADTPMPTRLAQSSR
jgi:uncharacterized protein YcbK (DUF882 family)